MSEKRKREKLRAGAPRIAKSVGVRAGFRSCVVYERRARYWLLTVAVGVVLVGSWVSLFYGDEMRYGPGIFFGFLGAIFWLWVACRLLPWGMSVRIDMDEKVCVASERFFLMPYRRRVFDLDGHGFAWGEVSIQFTKTITKERSDSLGCVLGLIFGPLLGILLTPKESEKVVARETRGGLVLVDPKTGRRALLMAVADQLSVEEALLEIQQLTP